MNVYPQKEKKQEKHLYIKKKAVPLQRFWRKALLKGSFGEMAEWSIAAVLKTVVLRGTGGSNPSLSAAKGVNQVITRFTPFFTPKNWGRVYYDYIKENWEDGKKPINKVKSEKDGYVKLREDYIHSFIDEHERDHEPEEEEWPLSIHKTIFITIDHIQMSVVYFMSNPLWFFLDLSVTFCKIILLAFYNHYVKNCIFV